MAKAPEKRSVTAIKVSQWLHSWDRVHFDPEYHRSKPEPHFFIFAMPAAELRGLCGIYRRDTAGVKPRAADLGIQRHHDIDRSEEISRFVKCGYPWSILSEAKRKSDAFQNLRKPGWLPTAIVVNIIKKGEEREGEKVSKDDIVQVQQNGTLCKLMLPYEAWSKNWKPQSVAPLEVIDGQHRLWAFERDPDAGFELPVVAFHGLDLSWQAYLFWTINIKPKRINPSLAFDLYPLLRAEDWLEKEIEGHFIYRETRSQELTEALWSHPSSPWYDRINMLGESGVRWVSQAAWIRNLMATFVKTWVQTGTKLGGLFGSRIDDDGEVLGWSRAQQAAFLIFAWQKFFEEVQKSNALWAAELRKTSPTAQPHASKEDQAFYGRHSLIVTDQGVRGFLQVLNDLCFAAASKLRLREWSTETTSAANDEIAVTNAIKSLGTQPLAKFVQGTAKALASFDWRTSAAEGLSDTERGVKLAYRGSSGYKEIRVQLLKHLSIQSGDVGAVAKRIRQLAA